MTAQVYNVAQLPKRLLYASGDPRDDSLFVDASRGDMMWSTDCLTKGDVMIKCKHYGAKKKVSIFKTTFHTSFSASKVQKSGSGRVCLSSLLFF